MSMSLIKPNTPTLPESSSQALEPSLAEDDFLGDGTQDEDYVSGTQHALPVFGAEPLSDKVIGLREWGAGRVFPLRAPRHSREIAKPDTSALQLTRDEVTTTNDRIEIVYEIHSWRIKDWSGRANLKQDGRPTREVSLMPGTEVTIAGRTFIAESPRSIALRNFCSRLLGWSDDRIAVVDC